jgi:hypothetical protein
MRITSSGNVGIGTSSPSTRLTVAGEVKSIDGTVSTYITSASGAGGYIGTRSNDYLSFQTNATDRMRIDSSGNVLVGATQFPSGNNIASFAIESTSTYKSMQMGKTYSGTIDALAMYHAGTKIGSVTYSNTNAAYNTSSDYRLKHDIEPMIGALNKVALLKPVTYKWNVDGSNGQGFIAHELQEVVPDCVTGEKDAVAEDGSIKPQGIDTSFLVATLTAAIQELSAKVAELEAKVK